MLKQFNTNLDVKNYNSTFPVTSLGYFLHDDNNPNNRYIPSLRSPIAWQPVSGFLDNVRTDFIANKFDNITFNSPITCKLILAETKYGDGTLSSMDYVILAGGFYINIAFRLKDANGNVVYTTIPYCLHDNNTTVFEGNGIEVTGIPKVYNGRYEFNFNIDIGLTIDRNVVGNDFSIECAVYTTDLYGRTDDTILYAVPSPSGGDTYRVSPDVLTVRTSASNIVVNTSNKKRSNSKFTLNDLWNNEVNLFDEIINYCKQYRIGVFCNDVHKKLTFKPLNIYFSDYKVIDWSDKLDISKNYTIQPITFDNKYVLFNYEKNDVQLNKSYNESFGTNYGEYKLITDYEFNNDEKKLFNNVHNVMTSTDNILNWEDLYTKTKVVYTLPAELYISNKDKDKKNISVFGSMLFFKGIVNFDTEYDLRPVKISDDTNFQTLTQTYFYSQDGEEGCIVRCDKYPLLDIVYDTNLCLFNTPMENYTYIPNHYDNTKGIYINFWKQYLDERYNTNNKIVTCYLHISPTDYMNFEFNKFIKIENQLYMVNKIYDYDITSNSSTKVDLITIQNIEGYTTNNYKIPLPPLTITDENGNQITDGQILNIGFENGKMSVTVYVSSNEPVEADFHDYSGDLSDVEINGASVLEIYQGYDSPPILHAGINVPLTISTVSGSGDFEIEMYLKTQSYAKTFIVKCVW
jgi:hypothetical protein